METKDTIKVGFDQLRRPALWISLVLVAAIPRVLAAFFLQNPDGDEYSYVNNIEIWRASMVAGTFSLKSLFGFWFPMYQFICAVICLFFDHPSYVSKLVSAVAGTGVCLLVFCITLKLVGRWTFAILAFLFIALNPPHVLYSAFTMTHVPHAFFVLGSLYFVMEKRWVVAACFVFIGGMMRIESWMLIALVPMLQVFAERRISLKALAILVIAPLLWLYISWDATGNVFQYFDTRKEYVDSVLAINPHLRTLSVDRARTDIDDLLYSANLVVLIGGLAGVWLACSRLIRLIFRQTSEKLFTIVAVAAYFASFLAFITFAYVTGNQPDIFDRYGLILFALGIPILAWTYAAAEARMPYLARTLMVVIILMSFADFEIKTSDIGLYIDFARPEQIIANNIRGRCESNANALFFCDDATVQQLSGMPKERFLSSSDLPSDREPFLRHLKDKGVEYLVHAETEESTTGRLFPELRSGFGSDLFQLVAPGTRKDWHGRVWLYKLQSPPPQT